MTNFATLAYLSYKGLFLWLNWPGYIFNVILRPGLLVLMFALLGRFAGDAEAAQAHMIGMASYSMPLILLAGILQSSFYDRAFGTLSFIFSSPGNRMAVFFTRGVMHYPNSIIAYASGVLFGWLVLDLDLSTLNWLSMIFSVLLIAWACTAFALFLGNLTVFFGEWELLMNGAFGLFIVMTGVIIPTTSLPGILGAVSQALPLTHGLVALRESFLGADIASLAGDLFPELGIGLSYAIAGFLVYLLVEAVAKRRSTLERAIA